MKEASDARRSREFTESYRNSHTSHNEVPSDFREQCCDTLGGSFSYDPLEETETETAVFDPTKDGVDHL
jgi:hypothetical protein